MPRRLLVLAGAVALALTASACNNPGAPYALKVNGVTLSRSDFEDELKAITADKDAAAAAGTILGIDPSSGTLGTATGDQSDPVSTNADFVRGWLTLRAQAELIHQEATRLHLTVDPATRAKVQDQIDAAFTQANNGTNSPSGTPGTNTFQALPTATQDMLLNFVAERGLLAPTATEAQARAAYDKDPAGYARICFSHILVADEAKANDLKAQLAAGADFAKLATTDSTDSSSQAQGGVLAGPTGQCWTKDEITAQLTPQFPEFANAILTAPTNVVVGPVKSSAGWHLVLVTAANTFEAGESAVMTDLQQQANNQVASRLETLAREASVSVGTWYGKWDTTKLVVVPLQTVVSAPEPTVASVPADTTVPAAPPASTSAQP